MIETKLLLEELDSTLRKYNKIEYEKLLPPLPDNEIDNYFDELGVNDENVKALYQWKNGEKEDSYCRMMIFGGFVSFGLSVIDFSGKILVKFYVSLRFYGW